MSIIEKNQLFTNIEKPKSDNLDYAIKILPNGLTVLFISNPDANKSSAALGVNVGNLLDKKDEAGLAHFCEHLLFMGTDKYPKENEYYEYLAKNSGTSNASTSTDKTVYYFDVSNEGFEKALDIFAQFFICPRFNEGSVEKEINAVDSEFSKNKNNDTWRVQHFKAVTTKADCAFNRFSTGTKETLGHPDIRDRIISFYKQYYSSDIMHLVVYSKKPVNELVKLVEDLFGSIRKIENFQKPRYDEVQPYDETNKKMLYKIVPIKNADEIGFEFYFPFYGNYNALPLGYLSSAFGHEGPNTLTSSFYKDNLCSSLTTSTLNCSKTYMKFLINICLTKKGLENYREVILRTLKFIKKIQAQKISESYYNDLKIIKQIKFDYKNKLSPIESTKTYVNKLINYKPEDVLVGGNLIKEFNEELIRKNLDAMTLDNLNIYFISKSFENECELTEPIYGIKYHKEKIDITEEEINSYTCPHPLDYPPKNIFIPKNFDILPCPENIGKYPDKILETKNVQAWFLQDNIFNKPKVYISLQFIFPFDICSFSEIKNRIISSILVVIIKKELGEILYLAEEASTKFEFKVVANKFQIKYLGFNDSLKAGSKEIFTSLKNLDLNNERCKEMIDLECKELLKKTKNVFYDINYKVNLEYLKRLLNHPAKNLEDTIDFLNENKISLEDVILFKNLLFKKSKIKWLIQGNITKEQSLDIINETHKIFEIDINEEKKRVILYTPTSPNQKES